MSVGRRTRRVPAVLVPIVMVIVAAGCTPPTPPMTFDPQRNDVRLARSDARVDVASALDEIAGNRTAIASAWMDYCAPEDPAENASTPQCSYELSTAVVLPDMATTRRLVDDGLRSAQCNNFDALSDQLDGWATANPGEPLPDADDFQPGVVAPIFTDCAAGQLWVRITSPTDPLRDQTITEAASTTSPALVTARPYSHEDTRRLDRSESEVIVLFTLTQRYHTEPQ